ncbi:MAG: M20 family peptidase, partial [Chloroflexi bacterium]|nr:M20 family peptidase [Chloroflexota bacterium]
MPPLPVSYFARRTDDYLQILIRFIEIESPSTDKAAVDRFGVVVAAELQSLGAIVEIVPQPVMGDHLIGRFPGRGESGGILIMCHMDTVHSMGALRANPARVSGTKLFGPGAVDMKGS